VDIGSSSLAARIGQDGAAATFANTLCSPGQEDHRKFDNQHASRFFLCS